MLYRKTSPVGLDKKIDFFQSRMFSKLESLFTADWKCYPRCYVNKKKNPDGEEYFIPEYGKTSLEYQDVLFDDKTPMLSFFIKGDTITQTNLIETATVSLIMSCNLNTIYPTIPHRADEELKRNIVLATRDIDSTCFKLESIDDGIDNVYSEFRNDNVLWSNISPRHIVRFNFTVRYEYTCSNVTTVNVNTLRM